VIILAHVVLWVCLGIGLAAITFKNKDAATNEEALLQVLSGLTVSGILIGIPISLWAVIRFWTGG
jgi:O-antigen/teichoic acid export membrane protein